MLFICFVDWRFLFLYHMNPIYSEPGNTRIIFFQYYCHYTMLHEGEYRAAFSSPDSRIQRREKDLNTRMRLVERRLTPIACQSISCLGRGGTTLPSVLFYFFLLFAKMCRCIREKQNNLTVEQRVGAAARFFVVRIYFIKKSGLKCRVLAVLYSYIHADGNSFRFLFVGLALLVISGELRVVLPRRRGNLVYHGEYGTSESNR